MIDDEIEALEQEFTAYLLAHGQTTAVEFADHVSSLSGISDLPLERSA